MEYLYQDEEIVLCVKPVGLDSEKELPEAIMKELGGQIFPVHRLDKNVGGLMVFARTSQAAAALSKAIQQGNLVKEYVALVHGVPPESGDWSDLLWKDSSKNKVYVVKRERRGVKPARFSGRIVPEYVNRVLASVEPSLAKLRALFLIGLPFLKLESPAAHVLVKSLVRFHSSSLFQASFLHRR